MARFILRPWSLSLGPTLLIAALTSGPAGTSFAEEPAVKSEVVSKGPAVGDALSEFEALDEQGNAWESRSASRLAVL